MLGEVKLSLDPATGDVIRCATEATNHAVTKDVTPDPGIQKIVNYWIDRWTDRQNEPLGSLTVISTSPRPRRAGWATWSPISTWPRRHRRDGNADFALVPADIGVDVIAPVCRPRRRVSFGEAWPVVGISPITTLA